MVATYSLSRISRIADSLNIHLVKVLSLITPKVRELVQSLLSRISQCDTRFLILPATMEMLSTIGRVFIREFIICPILCSAIVCPS